MEVMAVTRSVRISPRKMRLVADTIRGLPVKTALQTLSILKKRAVLPIEKTVRSALSNALHNAKADENKLIVKRIEISQGPFLKRQRPSTRGRVHPYKKRSSHITIILSEKEEKS